MTTKSEKTLLKVFKDGKLKLLSRKNLFLAFYTENATKTLKRRSNKTFRIKKTIIKV